MNVADTIEARVREGLCVVHLELENESRNHNVPPGAESHFRLVVVSDDFAGLTPVKRHQRIYALLSEEMAGPVHALALHTFTPGEWGRRDGAAAQSPACRGGSGFQETNHE